MLTRGMGLKVVLAAGLLWLARDEGHPASVENLRSQLYSAARDGLPSVVAVGEDTYDLGSDIPLAYDPPNELEIEKSLTIEGAGIGKSIIDGGGHEGGILYVSTGYNPNPDGTPHDGGVVLTVRGITFRNTSVAGGPALIIGALAGHILVEECEFINTRGDPGAIWAGTGADLGLGGQITLRNCRFTDNGSGSYACATVGTVNGIVLVEDCGFTGSRDAGALSGAVRDGAMTVANCVFDDNRAGAATGGGLDLVGVDPRARFTVRDSVFTRNRAASGGALQVSGYGGVSVSRCYFADNTASTGGAVAIALFDAAQIGVNDCYFLRNAGGVKGGGLFAASRYLPFSGNDDAGANVRVRNCVFADNTASAGGGVMGETGLGGIDFVNNTLVTNRCSAGRLGGGAAFRLAHNTARLRVWNNILWRNHDDDAPALVCDLNIDDDWLDPEWAGILPDPDGIGCEGTIAHNLIGEQRIAVGNRLVQQVTLSQDPMLDATFQFPSGSPVVDAGNNTAPHLPENDIGGRQRILDGNGDGIAVVDLGAREGDFQSHPVALILAADGSGGYFIRGTGRPDSGYRLLRASDVTGPWPSIATNAASASGFLEFRDLSPLPGRAFYRAAQP